MGRGMLWPEPGTGAGAGTFVLPEERGCICYDHATVMYLNEREMAMRETNAFKWE
jgi:hypothetical protein